MPYHSRVAVTYFVYCWTISAVHLVLFPYRRMGFYFCPLHSSCNFLNAFRCSKYFHSSISNILVWESYRLQSHILFVENVLQRFLSLHFSHWTSPCGKYYFPHFQFWDYKFIFNFFSSRNSQPRSINKCFWILFRGRCHWVYLFIEVFVINIIIIIHIRPLSFIILCTCVPKFVVNFSLILLPGCVHSLFVWSFVCEIPFPYWYHLNVRFLLLTFAIVIVMYF